MNKLRRLALALRCRRSDPDQVFIHRLRVGLVIAALILLFSTLR
ncbi:hypothetical protein [Pannonibacter carbonis]|nr:hypothetical protein [Pannonibacter carbonis]